jgi:hypothetical protein
MTLAHCLRPLILSYLEKKMFYLCARECSKAIYARLALYIFLIFGLLHSWKTGGGGGHTATAI